MVSSNYLSTMILLIIKEVVNGKGQNHLKNIEKLKYLH